MSVVSYNELPIRSKIAIAKGIGLVLRHLHEGKKGLGDEVLVEMKLRALYLDEEIQGALLHFAEEVDFQHVYDPWHKVTPEIIASVDRLLASMGFFQGF